MTRGKSGPPLDTIAALMAAAIILWICFFSHLAAIGLVGPDEPRYAEVAREMAASGNWVTPRLYGQPWFEKPILYYRVAAAAFRTLGINDVAARLPSALAALVVALAVAWLGWKRYGATTAWMTLMIFSTSIGALAFGRAAAPDMLFTAGLGLALCAAANAVARNGAIAGAPSAPIGSDRPALIFLGVWIAVATLAKGPAAIILAGGSVILWALLTQKWRAAFRMLHPLAILSFCVIALPWYVLCSLRNPGFFRTFILEHNFERYLTPVFQHQQPFWFFIPIILLGLLPWTPLLAGVVIDGKRIWREGTWRESPGLFFACWAIFPVIFFSLSESKLPGYVLPAFPPLAILLAHSFVRAKSMQPRVARWLGTATGAIWVALGASAKHWLGRLPAGAYSQPQIYRLGATIAVVAGVAGLAIVLLSMFRRPMFAMLLSALSIAGMAEYAGTRVLPRLDPFLSTRSLARNIQAARLQIETFQLSRDCEYGLEFYLGGALPEWSPGSLRPAMILAGPKGAAELKRLDHAVFYSATAPAPCRFFFLSLQPTIVPEGRPAEGTAKRK